ncbi:unnamed protein product [Heterobilharzia americana]|nr:unnamed protein product [Heterobilharzia americana]
MRHWSRWSTSQGVRLYNRRYRTNSEPSRVKNASTAENAEGDNAQPCLSNGRYRPRRRRGGGGGVGKSAKAQSGQNESYDDGTTTQQKSNDQSYKEGNISATPGVFPRQWRRPYGNIRHRSAPTRNFSTVNVGDGRFTSGEITGSQDSRYYQRGFRRPFRRPMGNFRYSNGYYIGRVNFSQSRFQPAYDSQNSQGGSYRGRGRGYNSRRPRRRFNNTDHVSSNGIRSVNGVTEQEKTNDTTSVHDIQKEVEADLSVNNLNNVDNVLPDTTESNE